MLIFIFLLDVIVVALCSTLLFRSGRLTYLHPGTIYLVFHLLAFSLRLFTLANGSPSLFSDDTSLRMGWWPVSEDEIIRAALIADAALFIMTLAWLKASEDDRRKYGTTTDDPKLQFVSLEINRLMPIIILTFAIGIFGILANSVIPGLDSERINLGDWGSSTWISMLQTWPGIALLMLIYWYGFKRPLVILMSLYMLLMIYQGYHRFRVIIPFILLTQIYVVRHGLKWPPRWLFVVLLLGAIAFFPLKSIGQMLQNGEPVSTIFESTIQQLSNLTNNAFSDLVFMDQFASALTLTDLNERFYYGGTYLPVLTLAIPRPLWPDKPELAFYLGEIQTPQRPMATLGMIVTFLGESYINFGYVGLVIIPFVFAYWLGRFYFYAIRKNYYSATFFFYLLTVSSLINVYRDALPSIVLFTFVNYMPIIIAIIIHVLFPSRRVREMRSQLR